MPKGKFIVIDGADGSGKTTQFNLLKEKLKKDGYQVETVDFPRYGEPVAVLVENYLNGKYGSAKAVGPYRASIFYACDRYDASFAMKEWLAQGKIILGNRYTTANMIHQAGKIQDHKERDKFLDWLTDLEYGLFAIPRPDAVFFMNLSAQVSQQLALKNVKRHDNLDKKKDIHENDLEHLRDALEAGQYVAKKYKWEQIDCDDGQGGIRSVEDIHHEICQKVAKYL